MSCYSLLLPPPNLTGTLHLGHLWNIVLQDFRYKWSTIRKYFSYWAIGVDHAGISFQSKFDSLFREKFSHLSPEEYLEEMNKYATELREKIFSQFSLITSSMDISKARYTLEEQSKSFVLKKFLSLFSQGLIYKKKKLVNWDIKLQEVLADCEVIHREENSKLYYLKYYFTDDSDKYLLVATSRIETIFGDVAVFVHPEDKRYSSFISKKVYIPGIKREIPVLADNSISQEFGTGVMKCTPAHDSIDWELKEKYSLDQIEVFDINGKLLEVACQFFGKDRLEARSEIVDWLQSTGELERIEDYKTRLSYSEKSNTLVEKLLTEQWFLAASKLAQLAAKIIRSGKFKLNIYPSSQKDRLLDYLDNTEDWCLSRQISWGIKVNMAYDKKFRKYRVNPDINDQDQFISEEIALDTWFSSGLWPDIVFLGSPKLRDRFFPFSTLVSGKDILFPWISRMIYLSLHFNAKPPFKNIFLHGILRNSQGEKMSKSLGNGILPEELYSKYSSDVIRFAFLSNTHFDRDIKYSENIFQKPINFIHKLEHLFKFFESKLSGSQSLFFGEEKQIKFDFQNLSWAERWIIREFSFLSEELEELFSSYDFSSLTKLIVTFFTEKVSNQFLELLKLEWQGEENSIKFLAYITELSCRILYPFITEFSEKYYKKLFNRELESVFYSIFYPKKWSKKTDEGSWFFEYMKKVRQLYHSLELDFSKEVKFRIVSSLSSASFKKQIEELNPYFRRLNQTLVSLEKKRDLSHFPTVKVGKLYFELLIDDLPKDKYKEFVSKELSKYSSEVERSRKILSRESFCSNAPEELILEEKRKYQDYLSEFGFYSELNSQL
ncbi:Valyl-tRNA synthetase [Mycoplasma suis KI3806]|uniref:Valine--tRNA ligase n=1 Tax=Mycoplasma suis (strain KI_3806) TaxID=708248 RepID=F0V1M0_MYCS3|nr:valine--tRNA ligase [Mycoplasma suis]CBZ40551.1 Valyl-tRNA synthetase [Mycoplasma suis KI3806]